MADNLRTREPLMREALWTLSHLIPGDPKAAAILDVRNNFEDQELSTLNSVVQASIRMLLAKQYK